MSQPARPVSVPQPQMYVTWDDDKSKALAFSRVGNALQKIEPVVRRTTGSNIYENIYPGNVSIRDGFTRMDWENYRPEEARPRRPKDVVMESMRCYDNHGLVRNIVDLMADFACQGIDLYHPNERIEAWHQEWFRRVHAKERSERFLNLLYRTANVIGKRQTAIISVQLEKEMRRAGGKKNKATDGTDADPAPLAGEGEDADADVDDPTANDYVMQQREIPWKYTFLNPMTIQVLGDDLASFIGVDSFVYALEIPQKLAQKIKAPKNKHDQYLVQQIPQDIRQIVENGERTIPLDPNKIVAFYYKRDDRQIWATPMIAPIFKDLQLLEKMKLADLAALDGAISCIRVWKLGDIKNKILPSELAIQRLSEMLMQNVGGGVMDLVWGPEIDLLETSTDVHRFLGHTKYEPVLNAIFQGLGIPPSLTGSANPGGFTNNFISLKTLTERLQYGRDVLCAFWEEELRLVQKAMGFRFPATLTFDRMCLSDEAAEKKLLIDLADRDIISWESVVELFGHDPAIEAARLRRETRKRKSGQLPPKADVFHNAQQEFALKKIFAQLGTVTPSEVGVELEENDGEKTLIDQQAEQTVKQQKLQLQAQNDQNDHQLKTEKLQLKHGVHPGQLQKQQMKGVPGQGRPTGTKDSGPRKQKRVTPRTSATFFETMAWAENAQAAVLRTVGPSLLRSMGKETMRELTDEESRNFEEFKFRVLCQFDAHAPVGASDIERVVAGDLGVPSQVMELLHNTISKHAEVNGKEPPLEVLRRYQAGVYAFYKGEFEDSEDGDGNLEERPQTDPLIDVFS